MFISRRIDSYFKIHSADPPVVPPFPGHFPGFYPVVITDPVGSGQRIHQMIHRHLGIFCSHCHNSPGKGTFIGYPRNIRPAGFHRLLTTPLILKRFLRIGCKHPFQSRRFSISTDEHARISFQIGFQSRVKKQVTLYYIV